MRYDSRFFVDVYLMLLTVKLQKKQEISNKTSVCTFIYEKRIIYVICFFSIRVRKPNLPQHLQISQYVPGQSNSIGNPLKCKNIKWCANKTMRAKVFSANNIFKKVHPPFQLEIFQPFEADLHFVCHTLHSSVRKRERKRA